MTCPKCGQPLEPWPNSDHPLWLRCPQHGQWKTTAGVPLHESEYRKTGALDDQPLCPDAHEAGR